MNRTLKIFLSALLINSMVISTVFAEPISQQLQNQQNKLAQDKSSLKTVQDQKNAMEISIENLDNQIQNQMSKITENKNLISQKQLDIKATELEIQKIDEDIIKDQTLLNVRIKAMYMNGNDSYAEVLLSAKGLSDFISKVEIVKKVMEFDKKTVKNLKDKRIDSNNKKEVLNSENNKLIELGTQNEANLSQLKQYIANQNSMIITLKSKEFALSSNVDLSQAAVNETLIQIDAIRKAAPKISVSRGAVTVSSNNVIAYATNFLGTQYVWGGTTPAGFDCSGFTQYVYAHFGIRLGRTTYDQINDGFAVSRGNLELGDLVFFGTNGPTHVGIYTGNGTYINAPRTGDVVKVASVDRSDFITGRRVK
ncbi:MAG TPA: NlpC/P60 family protein [Clostridiaceae bacterium]